MKLFMSCLAISLIGFSAFADDSAPTSITIGGDNADQIAYISSLSSGTTGNSSFATGNVSVSCSLSTPLNSDEQAAPQHYSCNLAKSVKIVGSDADQISLLSFLYTGTTGNSSFATGNVHVSCRVSTPLGQDIQEAAQHYSCILSAAK